MEKEELSQGIRIIHERWEQPQILKDYTKAWTDESNNYILYFENKHFDGIYDLTAFRVLKEETPQTIETTPQTKEEIEQTKKEIKQDIKNLIKKKTITIKTKTELIKNNPNIKFTLYTEDKKLNRILNHFVVKNKELVPMNFCNLKRYLIKTQLTSYLNSRSYILFSTDFIDNNKVTIEINPVEIKEYERIAEDLAYWLPIAFDILVKQIKEKTFKIQITQEVA